MRELFTLCLTLAALTAVSAAEAYRDDFTTDPPKGWSPWSRAQWKCEGGAVINTNTFSKGWGRRLFWLNVFFRDGELKLRGKAIMDPRGPFKPCFGAIVKRFSMERNLRAIVGLRGDVRVVWREEGAATVKVLGKFEVKLGQWYDMTVTVKGARLWVSVDGKRFGPVEVPFAGEAGHPGLYSETQVAYDFFEVDPVEYFPGAVLPGFSGAPSLRPIFTAWRPDAPNEGQSFTDTGSVFAYYKNVGDGPIELQNAALVDEKGRQVKALFRRQHPFRVAPGKTGELQIRVQSLPQSVFQGLFERPDRPVRMIIKATPRKGKPCLMPVHVTRHGEKLQINFMAFGPDLKTVYVYAQNNGRVMGRGKEVIHLARVFLDGRDVTSRTTFGSKVVADDVVPLIIRLDKPLAKGRFAVVNIVTRKGARCGHALRAFPAAFPIQVTFVGPQVRKDAVRDAHNHCFSAIGKCITTKAKRQRAFFDRRTKELGMDALVYAGTPNAGSGLDEAAMAPIVGVWCDEVEKIPRRQGKGIPEPAGAAWYYSNLYEVAEAVARLRGKPMPFQFYNVMRPNLLRGYPYLTQSDGICHEYGERRADELGRVDRFGRREYRRARRPFWPYFRAAEMRFKVDEKARRVLAPWTHVRPISPHEERFYTYSVLINGAKGVCHWPYAGYVRGGRWIRLGMGGGMAPKVSGFVVPAHVYPKLKRTWDAMGRINAELQTVGPLVARADVSYRAKVVTPAGGEVEAAALVSGLDTMVLIVVDHDFTRAGYTSADKETRFTRKDVRVKVALPTWLKPKSVFQVDWNGLKPLRPRAEGDALVLDLPGMMVGRIVVITSSDRVAADCRRRLEMMRERLRRIPLHKPEFFPERVARPGGTAVLSRTKADTRPNVVYLSDLKPTVATQWSFSMRNDTNLFGKPLRIEGREFQRGLATHGYSMIAYPLEKRYERFAAWVGIDDSSGAGSAEFLVYVDGALRWRSGFMTGSDPARRCAVSVAGGRELALTLDGGIDGKSSDHGDWADAKLFVAAPRR